MHVELAAQMFTMIVSADCKDAFISSTQNFKTQINFIGLAIKKLEMYVGYVHAKK